MCGKLSRRNTIANPTMTKYKSKLMSLQFKETTVNPLKTSFNDLTSVSLDSKNKTQTQTMQKSIHISYELWNDQMQLMKDGRPSFQAKEKNGWHCHAKIYSPKLDPITPTIIFLI
jgi:hypothetical protein